MPGVPGIAVFRSGSARAPLTLTSGAAATTALTINAHASQSADLVVVSGIPPASATKAMVRLGASALSGASTSGNWLGIVGASNYAGDLINAQVSGGGAGFAVRGDGAGGVRLGIGVAPTAGRLQITGTGNNETDASIIIKNADDGNAVGAGVNFNVGSSNSASSYLFQYNGAYAGVAAFQDKLVMGLNSTATGIYLGARAAGQTIELVAGGTAVNISLATGTITIGNGQDFVFNTGTGSKLGTATTQKIGVWNATPVARPSAYTQTYSTATKTHSNLTAAALTHGVGTADGTVDDVGGAFNQTTLNNNFKELTAQIANLVTDVTNVKGVVNSVIDDQQTIGWFA